MKSPKNFKILFSSETLYPFIGGADVSLYTLMEELVKKGYQVFAVYSGAPTPNSKINSFPLKIRNFRIGTWNNLFLHMNKWKKHLKKVIKKVNPDLIVTWDSLLTLTSQEAVKAKKPYAILIRSYTHLSIDGFEWQFSDRTNFLEHLKFLLQKPVFSFFMRLNKKAFASTPYIYSPSQYVTKVTKDFYKKDMGNFSTLIRKEDYLVERENPEYITYIGPSSAKGVEVFRKIALALPKKKFVVAGRLHPSIKDLPNVTCMGWVRDMREVYNKTKVILIPSIWPDPFPRVTFETMLNGIPCICSPNGGMKEAVEGAGIVVGNVFNINEWVQGIKKFDSPKYYKKSESKTRKRFEKYCLKNQLRIFEEILERVCRENNIS